MADLDILFPNIQEPDSFTAEDKVKYTVRYFIPAAVSILWAERDGEEADKSGAKRQLKVLALFLSHQYPHMDEAWIEQNISMQIQNVITMKIAKELQQSNILRGEAEEAAKP